MNNDKKENGHSRKEFLKKASIGSAGLALGTFGMTAKSYSNILGANDRVNFAIIGLHSQGKVHIKAISKMPNARIKYLCDVDSRILKNSASMAKKLTGQTIETNTDFRRLLEKEDLDAISIVTPDHWHTPMTILGVKSGKHVYVEKPCSHNPAEGKMLIRAQQKYPELLIQMGNEERSDPVIIEAIQLIDNGIIGRPYFAKAWYDNDRKSIGFGTPSPVPDELDWNLWQGPAPRRDYESIWVPYNWHWFWNWGTGEICNNGIHELEVCRWALGVNHPTKVNSSGGRYAYNDDWQFYDTQVASFEFDEKKMISWEGRSCNPFPSNNHSRGSLIFGTKGSILITRNEYIVYNMDNEVVKKKKNKNTSNGVKIVGSVYLEMLHLMNFVEAIKGKEAPNEPIQMGASTTLLCHLGNIAQATGRTLNINRASGKIENDSEAMDLWGREYEPGWKPTI
jgi:predicted dehydrogenase